ncbi:hypothetical protein KBY72_14020 [Cyanobium sp. BA5m-21]|uniref:hypothetical protein n=1 Tax=unclassified Cyanobium TaxID=2627006 RepID=UPI0020CE5372|nr:MULTISPECIES: hypothetical protein [unclassified Cyanobium]MCP9903102.1 hypothetical protein [Cyanobium sp. BA5m-10]MCP9908276.1 hypothetical protein [Cyanobium sp. BA5m-21]
MKSTERKVLKLGISERDLQRFIRVQSEEQTPTLAKTLSRLLDDYERANGVRTPLPTLRKGPAATQRLARP